MAYYNYDDRDDDDEMMIIEINLLKTRTCVKFFILLFFITRNAVIRFLNHCTTMKNGVFWDFTPCGSCKSGRFGEPGASFIRVTRIGELGTTQAANSNRRTLRGNTK
jgi:hypothetical protein